MIDRNNLLLVGRIVKPHGTSGEMSVMFTSLPFMDVVDEGDCVMMDIDGIMTPFFVRSVRTRSTESLLIALDGIDSQEQAAQYTGQSLWADQQDVPAEEIDEDGGLYAAQLIGYHAYDSDGTSLGDITDIDDTTDNALFIIDDSLMVPIADELIADIDTDKHVITLDLPEGYIEALTNT